MERESRYHGLDRPLYSPFRFNGEPYRVYFEGWYAIMVAILIGLALCTGAVWVTLWFVIGIVGQVQDLWHWNSLLILHPRQ